MKPIICGLDYIRNADWQPIKLSKKGAQQLASRLAKKEYPKGFWVGVVADLGTHYRVSVAGQPHK